MLEQLSATSAVLKVIRPGVDAEATIADWVGHSE
jgi:hypothetical protein